MNSEDFYSLLSQHVHPAIDHHCELSLNCAFQNAKDQMNELELFGDCRYDSTRGAKFCTFSFLNENGYVIDSETVHKSEYQVNSSQLERISFENIMKKYSDSGWIHNIKAFIYDPNNEIINTLKRYNDQISIYNDFWHIQKNSSKNLKKRLKKIGLTDSETTHTLKSFRNFLNDVHIKQANNVDMKKELEIFVCHIFDDHSKCDDMKNCHIQKQYTAPLKSRKDDTNLRKSIKDLVSEKKFLNYFKYFGKDKYTYFNESFNRYICDYSPKIKYHENNYVYFVELAIILWNTTEKLRQKKNIIDSIIQGK
jgi:hypothetical protein